MGNAVATTSQRSNAMAAYGAGGDPFSAAANDMGASGAQFLKFNGNTGDFTYGSKDDELAIGTQLAVNMVEFKRGHICWKEGEVVEEIMVRVVEGNPPAAHTLTDHGPYAEHDDGTSDGWSEESSVPFRDTGDGAEYLFKTSSKSGLRALANLLKDYGKQFRNHPGEAAVVELDNVSFIPKSNPKIGKKYAPTFKIVGWLSEAEMEAIAGPGGEDAADYEGGATAQEPAAPTPAPAPVEPKVVAAPAKAEATAAPATAPAGGRRGKRF